MEVRPDAEERAGAAGRDHPRVLHREEPLRPRRHRRGDVQRAAEQGWIHFNKVQCFCFEEQRLRAGEEVDMPVFFYLDPEFAADPAMVDVRDVTLSYTFFRSDDFDELEEEEEEEERRGRGRGRGEKATGVRTHGTGAVPPGIKGHAALAS